MLKHLFGEMVSCY